jgi:hypothetical protein
MTLPFSDKPEKSSIYQDLKTTTLQDLTPDQFDQFKERMFSEGVNGLEDEYRRLLLLGLASDKISTSGPLANTQFVNKVNNPGSAGTHTLFTPSDGEVWQICAVGIQSFGTGTTYAKIEIKDNNLGNAVQLDTVSSGFKEFDINEPVYVGYPCQLQYNTDGTDTAQRIEFSLIRVR